MTEVFAALGDATRWKVLEAVAAAGAATATSVALGLPVTRPAVIKHLGVLERAGLVARAKHGKEVRFTVRADRLAAAARSLSRLAAHWDQRLAALRKLAEST